MSIPSHHKKRPQRPVIRYISILSVLLLLSMSMVSSTTANTLDPVDFSIWLDGPIEAAPGQFITYDITTDANSLFGAQLDIGFDPAVLQVVGTELTPGSCPVPDFVVLNSVDNGLGSISYAATALAPSLPCDGGIVASFQFKVSASATPGTTLVQFDNVILANSNGLQIPASAIDLDLKIVGLHADFSGTPTTGPAPLTVSFTNLSSGDYVLCAWDFGDNSGSSLCDDQDHIYTMPGTYYVQLTIIGENGSDIENKPDYIVIPSDFAYLPVILK